MRRAVERGQERGKERVISHVGVNEKAFRKGHKYMMGVCDIERGTVEFVAEDGKVERPGDLLKVVDHQLVPSSKRCRVKMREVVI